MASQKILVTGSGGFIGGHFARFMKDMGYWVRGVDFKRHQWMSDDEFCNEFIQLDLTNEESCDIAITDIDEVYNFAANMGGIGYIMSHYADVIRDNVSINKNILEACIRGDAEKIFFSSSACIYPEYLQDQDFDKLNGKYILKESDAFPADPDSFYGWEKLFSEMLYWAYHLDYGLDIRIARFHNIQGIFTEWEEPRCKAPAALCRKIALLPSEGGEIEVWGDGKQVRSFLDVRDCCEGVYKLMNITNNKYYSLGIKNKPRPPAINIGSNEAISINELIDIISIIAKKKVEKKYNLEKPQGVRSRSADLSLLQHVLKWKSNYNITSTMEWLYNWINNEISSA